MIESEKKDYLEQPEPVELVGDRSIGYQKVKMGYGRCTDCKKNTLYNVDLEPILCAECYFKRVEKKEAYKWK